MRRTITANALILPVLLSACNKEEDFTPTEEMETAVMAWNDATSASMLAAELMNPLASEDDGAAKSVDAKAEGYCPEVTSTTSSITLDYGEGCVPDSGLVPYEVSGSVTLERDYIARSLTGTADELVYGPAAVDGYVTASYSLLGGGTGVDIHEEMVQPQELGSAHRGSG